MFVTGLIQESNPDRLASWSSTATLAYLRRVERLAGRGEARRGEGVFVVYPRLCRSIGRKRDLDLGLKQ